MSINKFNNAFRALRTLKINPTRKTSLPYLGHVYNLWHEGSYSNDRKSFKSDPGDQAAGRLSVLIRRWNAPVPFCASGFMPRVNGCNLEFNGGGFEDIHDNTEDELIESIDEDNLNGVTEYDSFEITENGDSCNYVSHILTTILEQSALLEGKCVIENQKVQVCSPSMRTVNSPYKDADSIATLVVCLPSKHEGGALLVRQDGMEQKIDFSSKSDCKKGVQWAAFFGDCEHEVLPVTSGRQVTLSFTVKALKLNIPYETSESESESERDSERDSDSDSDSYVKVKSKENQPAGLSSITETVKSNSYQKIDNGFRTLHSLPSNFKELVKVAAGKSKSMGFVLRHQYDSNGTLTPKFLKEEDLKLYKHLCEEYGASSVKVEPILLMLETGYDESLSRKLKTAVYQQNSTLYDPALPTTSHELVKHENEKIKFILSWPESINEMSSVFGNEIYSLVALVVKLEA